VIGRHCDALFHQRTLTEGRARNQRRKRRDCGRKRRRAEGPASYMQAAVWYVAISPVTVPTKRTELDTSEEAAITCRDLHDCRNGKVAEI
jgi:hypothetical protein